MQSAKIKVQTVFKTSLTIFIENNIINIINNLEEILYEQIQVFNFGINNFYN